MSALVRWLHKVSNARKTDKRYNSVCHTEVVTSTMGATAIGLAILLGDTGRPEAVLIRQLSTPEGRSGVLMLDSVELVVLGEVE